MRTAVRVTSVLVVCVLLCAGCFASKETREGADKLEDAIGTPTWATSVEVETGITGIADDTVETIVVLDAGARAEEIADFVVDHPERVEDAGLQPGFGDVRFLTSSGAALIVPAEGATDEEGVRAAVARWERVLPLLGTGASAELSRVTGGVSYTASLPGGGAASLAALFGGLRGDAELATEADAWSVSSGEGDLGVTLRSFTLPTWAEVATLSDLAAAMDELPESARATEVSLERLENRTILDQTLVLLDDVTAEELTPQAHPELWPALRGQLDAANGIEGPWTYLVQWAQIDAPESRDILLSLLSDQPPIDNGDAASQWSKRAKAYVDSL